MDGNPLKGHLSSMSEYAKAKDIIWEEKVNAEAQKYNLCLESGEGSGDDMFIVEYSELHNSTEEE